MAIPGADGPASRTSSGISSGEGGTTRVLYTTASGDSAGGNSSTEDAAREPSYFSERSRRRSSERHQVVGDQVGAGECSYRRPGDP